MPNFVAAIKQIAAERGLDVDSVINAIKQAIRIIYKKDYPEEMGALLEIEVDLEEETVAVYADKKVVDVVTSPPTQISLEDAQELEPKLKVGDHIWVEITHEGDFGRVAAQAARQVITQMLQEEERNKALTMFEERLGEIEVATVVKLGRAKDIFLEIQKAQVIMPVSEQIYLEQYRVNDKLKVLLKEVKNINGFNQMVVSRADNDFVRALFEMEVPEIASGTVEIVKIVREAGTRTKVAVKSNSDGVDAVGSCIGQRGVRISAVTNELRGRGFEERVEVVEYREDVKEYIKESLKPAQVRIVEFKDEENQEALILVDDESLSLAIGREGQNVRLANKLTGWKLDVQGFKSYYGNDEEEADEDSIESEDESMDSVPENAEVDTSKSEDAVEEQEAVEEGEPESVENQEAATDNVNEADEPEKE